MLGAVIGAFIMGVMNNGMSILGIGIDYQQVIKGLVLLAAVFVDVYNKRKAIEREPARIIGTTGTPPDRKSMHARIVRDLGMRIVGWRIPAGARACPSEAVLLADYDGQPAGAARGDARARCQGPGAVTSAGGGDGAAAQRLASAGPGRAVLVDSNATAACVSSRRC